MNNYAITCIFGIIFLLSCPLVGFGQMRVEYFDENWEVMDSANAAFYREITYDAKGQPVGKVKDYWVNGKLFWEGQLLSVEPEYVREGVCIMYYKNGQKKREVTYKNGRMVNLFEAKEWSPSGRLEGVLDKDGYFFSEPYLNDCFDWASELWNIELAIDSMSFEIFRKTGTDAYKKGDLTLSMQLFKIGHDICKNMNNEVRLSAFYHNIGLVYEKLNSSKLALQYYKKSTSIRKKYPKSSGLATTYHNMGATYVSLKQYSKALKYFNKAKEIRDTIGNRKKIAETLHGLGYAYCSKRDFKKGLTYYFQALEIREDLKDALEIAISYRAIGTAFSSMGFLSKAIEFYKLEQTICEDLNLKIRLTDIYHNIATRYNVKGDYETTLLYLEKAKSVYEELNQSQGLAHILDDIGFNYYYNGNYSLASTYFQKANKVRGESQLKSEQMATTNNLGFLHIMQGKEELALQYFQRTIKLHQKSNNSIELGKAYNNIGHLYIEKNEFREAKYMIKKALKIAKKQEILELQIKALINLGTNYAKKGRIKKSLKTYMTGAILAKDLGFELDLSVILSSVSNMFMNNMDIHSALGVILENIRIQDQLRESYLSHSDRLLIQQKSIETIGIGVLCAVILNKDSLAYSLMQHNKNRILSDLIAEQNIKKANIPNEIKKEYDKIKLQLKKVSEKLYKTDEHSERKRFISHRDSLYQQKIKLENRIRIKAPEYTNLVYPQLIELKELQQTLHSNEILVDYYQGLVQTYCTLVTSDSFEIIPLPLAKIETTKKTINSFQTNYLHPQKDALQPPDNRENTRLKKVFHQHAYEFYKALWQPIEATGLLKNKKIILIPDGPLHYLPFELLVRDSVQMPYKEYNYLIKDYEMTYYPSATVLHYERTKEQKPPAPKDFFGLGVKDFKNNHCYEDKFIQFDQLDHSVNQVRGIAQLFPEKSRQTLLLEEANKQKFKSMVLKDYRYIHLASHGLINAENPNFSKILLHNDCLNLYEMFDLDLNAELVSLSACETGLGQLVRGEGMVGFTRALMYAGTPSVILSLWEVFDDSTSSLFVNYYQQLKDTNGKDKYTPLRHTQLKMIENGGKYANPHYWAPFVFIGAR